MGSETSITIQARAEDGGEVTATARDGRVVQVVIRSTNASDSPLLDDAIIAALRERGLAIDEIGEVDDDHAEYDAEDRRMLGWTAVCGILANGQWTKADGEIEAA